MPKSITRSLFIAALATLAFTGPAFACGDYAAFEDLQEFTPLMLSEDPEEASDAIGILRQRGSNALHWAIHHHRAVLAEQGADGQPTAAAKKALRAIDKLAGQQDAMTARLFWHTDMDEALKAAKHRSQPILSLRLLGRLDEDLSCANSRFFRTALYANADVGRYLRRNFVLHWQSVRPVPVVTIDFGDGRKICRTITGNSIHYVLDPEGRVVDALPGLYGPKAFQAGLERIVGFERELRQSKVRDALLAKWHKDQGARIDAAFAADLARIGDPRGRPTLTVVTDAKATAAPSARRAAIVAIGKGIAEMPILKAIQPRATDLIKDTDDEAWAKIAALHAADARLDDGSRDLFRRKLAPSVITAIAAAAESKRAVEDPMLRTLRRFERSMAEDTVRNEYDLHRKLHDWFAAVPAETVDALNERVYADLFLTPSSDPWLGLVPADTFTALDGAGLAVR